MDLQKVAEQGLEKTLQVANNGGIYKSEYGDVSTSGGAKNAKTAAIIAVDIKTGEVLASASYPDYDPNLFVTGISSSKPVFPAVLFQTEIQLTVLFLYDFTSLSGGKCFPHFFVRGIFTSPA